MTLFTNLRSSREDTQEKSRMKPARIETIPNYGSRLDQFQSSAGGLDDRRELDEIRGALTPGLPHGTAETSESVGWQNFGKMLLVFSCIGSDFARKYVFCSIFQNLPDS